MRAIDVANFYIKLGKAVDNAEVTNARVNKLLYFAQGWYLALKGTPLFDDDFEAWQYGPVIPSIYRTFSICGSNIIPNTTVDDESDKNITKEDEEFLINVFSYYLDHSTNKLISLTHDIDTPFSQVYVRGMNSVITKKSMKKYFSDKFRMSAFINSINKTKKVGYINNDGYTVLPKEYYYREEDELY